MNQRTANYKGVLSVIFVTLTAILLTIPFYLFVVANDNKEVSTGSGFPPPLHLVALANNNEAQELSPTEQSVKECLSLPNERDACLFEICSEINQSPYLCASVLLDITTKISGPGEAMKVLDGIVVSSLFAIQEGNTHFLAHIIGRATSNYYGLSSESFIWCPADFNYGCQHGFFEHALEKESDPVKAAVGICGKDDLGSCYHGVGHGFVFHTSCNLMDALSLCDQLPQFSLSQQRCYGGVFMENVTCFHSNTDGETGFLEDDLLAPCNRVGEQYYDRCWKEHGLYLLEQYDWSIENALRFCLTTGKYIDDCIIALGYTTVEIRQLTSEGRGTPIEIAAYYCSEFPSEYITLCQTTTIENLVIVNTIASKKQRVESEEASEFCLSFTVGRNDCFWKIGHRLMVYGISIDDRKKGCDVAPQEYRDSCYEGAGVHQEPGMLS